MLAIAVEAHDDVVAEVTREPKPRSHRAADAEMVLEAQPAHAERRKYDGRIVVRAVVDDQHGDVGEASAKLSHDAREVRRFVPRRNEDEDVAFVRREFRFAGRGLRPRPRRWDPHTVGGARPPSEEPAPRPHADRETPREIAKQMDRREPQAGRIAKRACRPDACNEALDGENDEHEACKQCRRLRRTAHERTDGSDGEAHEGEQHQRRVGDHPRPGGVVAGKPPRMLCNDVQATIPDAILLGEISTRVLAPVMHAAGGATERQPIARVGEPVAHVVVRAVAKRLVEEVHATQRVRTIRGIAGAHVIHVRPPESPVALLEIQPRHPRPHARARGRHVVPLARGSAMTIERVRHVRQPARRENHVLVDLTDDRMDRVSDPEVHCGRDAPPFAREHTDGSAHGVVAQNRRRTISAAVVHDDDLQWPAVVLRKNRGENLVQPVLAVQCRHDEADTDTLITHVTTGMPAAMTPSYTLAIRAAMVWGA